MSLSSICNCAIKCSNIYWQLKISEKNGKMLIYLVFCLASAKDLNVTQADSINGTVDISQIMASKYAQCTNPTGPEIRYFCNFSKLYLHSRCDLVPDEYQDCDPPIFKSKNEIISSNETLDYLETCYVEELGGQYYELVKQVYVTCRILDDIDCCGDRSFYSKGFFSIEWP